MMFGFLMVSDDLQDRVKQALIRGAGRRRVWSISVCRHNYSLGPVYLSLLFEVNLKR
jgi:hypothetical protein